MKKHLFGALLILCAGSTCGQSAKTSSDPAASDFARLNWLEGTWTRTNSKPGRSGQEQWIKKSATEWQGRGVTLQGKDTAFVEKIKLVIQGDIIYYVADVPENKRPVYFKFTEISAAHFVCENPEHDFPKKIVYRREGSTLKATISGDGKSIEYWFEKK